MVSWAGRLTPDTNSRSRCQFGVLAVGGGLCECRYGGARWLLIKNQVPLISAVRAAAGVLAAGVGAALRDEGVVLDARAAGLVVAPGRVLAELVLNAVPEGAVHATGKALARARTGDMWVSEGG